MIHHQRGQVDMSSLAMDETRWLRHVNSRLPNNQTTRSSYEPSNRLHNQGVSMSEMDLHLRVRASLMRVGETIHQHHQSPLTTVTTGDQRWCVVPVRHR